jgi:hypothetical protein
MEGIASLLEHLGECVHQRAPRQEAGAPAGRYRR